MGDHTMFKAYTPHMGPVSAKDAIAPAALDLAGGSTISAAAAPQKNRCGSCRKKLTLTDMECRCKIRFCAAHRLPEEHACSFDHRGLARATLTQQLVKVVGDKLEHI
jgi:hypothetical protein